MITCSLFWLADFMRRPWAPMPNSISPTKKPAGDDLAGRTPEQSFLSRTTRVLLENGVTARGGLSWALSGLFPNPAKNREGEKMPIVVNDILYGDAVGSLVKHQHADSQTLDLSVVETATVGDVDALLDHSRGGDDTMIGEGFGLFSILTAIGDAFTIADHAKGGNDTITGSGFGVSIYGDATAMTGHGR
jgi:hypothetical protein